jgi:hypothetical protein
MFRRLIASVALFLLAAAGARAQGIDVSSQITVSRTGLVFDRATQTFNSIITLTNTGSMLNGPLTVVLSTGVSSVGLQNGAVAGSFYSIQIPVPASGLVTGQSVQTVLEFSDPQRIGFQPTINWITASAPGTLTTQAVDNSVGGTVVVNAPGNPLNGAQVAVPPGALAGPSDVIQIGTTPTLPGPPDPDAAAAGMIVVSPIVVLNTASGKPFEQPVYVTIPYSTSLLPAPDVPAVFYWETDLNRYMGLQTLSVNTTTGRITFATIHFSPFVGMGIVGLANGLVEAAPFPALLRLVDTGFLPDVNGFREENFSTRSGNIGGVCYGVASYAQWYYAKHLAALYTLWNSADPLNPAFSVPNPVEDDVARELINDIFSQTSPFSRTGQGRLVDLTDLQTVETTIDEMTESKVPQLLYLYNKANFNAGAHSVLAYKWDSSLPGFDIYDPNIPGQAETIGWSFLTSTLQPYGGFPSIVLDSSSSYVAVASLMPLEYVKAQAGWPAKHFDELSVSSPQVYSVPFTFTEPDGTSASLGRYPLNSGGTQFSLTYTPNPPAPGQPPPPPPYAHIYVDGTALTTVDLEGAGFAFEVPTPASSPPHELVVIVSNSPTTENASQQAAISDGYDGFFRAELCSLNGTWQGQYSGTTITHKGKPKGVSGPVTAVFAQDGTSVSGVVYGVSVSGTNDDGTVTVGAEVPCRKGTSECPAGLTGTLSPDCSTLSGSFYVDRPRTIEGQFSLQFTAPP